MQNLNNRELKLLQMSHIDHQFDVISKKKK